MDAHNTYTVVLIITTRLWAVVIQTRGEPLNRIEDKNVQKKGVTN